jgi:hypothetical protein
MGMEPRKRGESATGQNAGPDQAGEPAAERLDAPMGTTSGDRPDARKLADVGKPERGARDDADTTP